MNRLVLPFLILFGAAWFALGVNWGLPTTDSNRFLFGDHPLWTGAQLLDLSGKTSRKSPAGADVDVNPITDRTHIVELNETDKQRAEIAIRYRLFSYQPDEMQTIMSLGQMKPSQFDLDPKMYKYGGLWIYPVGAMLKITSVATLLKLKPDTAFYLDSPKEIGPFYLVARIYTILWAILGIWSIYQLALRLSESKLIASLAALCFIFLPVVVNTVHEAKPHLPGAVLMLLAILAADQFLKTTKPRWALITGAICGAAVGMVLSTWPIVLILPAIIAFHRTERMKTLLMSVGAAIIVFFATNPYIAIHLLNNRELLRANLQNSADFYHPGISFASLKNALRLVAEGTSIVLTIVALFIVICRIISIVRKRKNLPGATAILILIPATVILLQFTILASHQPPDYARFALFGDIALMLGGITGMASILQNHPIWRGMVLGVVTLSVMMFGCAYEASFVRDSGPRNSRSLVARELRSLQEMGARTLGVYAEPAPYSMPAFDLFQWKIVLLPKNYHPGGPDDPDVIVRVVDLYYPRISATPMSWASKRFEIWQSDSFRARVRK